jgi:hypothetical protein
MSNETQTEPFYNVMPEVTGSKTIPTPHKAPVTKVNAAAADGVLGKTGPQSTSITMAKPGKLKSFFGRKAVIIPLIIIILGVAGTAAWLMYFSKGQVKDEEPQLITPTEPAANPDVTTPGEWLGRYFGSETCTTKDSCGDSADPDRDGLTNKEEFDAGTDPNNPDSDSDGLADGDEIHIFNSEPLLSRSFREGDYNDTDFVKGGYDIKTNTVYTDAQLIDLKAKIKDKGLHQPTLTTIGELAITLYDFQDPSQPASPDLNIDQSPQAKLDRDTNRQTTIKKIAGALLKYKKAKNLYPEGNDFVAMTDKIAPFNTVATNYNDPINKEQYVYGYTAGAGNADFTLSYYSETQNQLIKYTSKNAEEAAAKDSAQSNDQTRIADLENIKSALMIYSTANVDSNGTQPNVFPTKDQYPSALIPRYITSVPKDPNGQDYSYEVSPTYNSFTLKAILQNPPAGSTGYMCTQDECRNF